MNLVDIILGPVASLIEKYVPSAADKQAAAMDLLKLQQSTEFQELDTALKLAQAQTGVNQVEAASADKFTSRWRPFIGWICGSGLAVQFLVGPLFTWVAALAGHPIAFPQLDMATLLTLLAGMLGLGGLRTMEKLQGKA
jgi:hypothetical protein